MAFYVLTLISKNYREGKTWIPGGLQVGLAFAL